MNERDLKLTDLDYAIADHRLQMLKAAIPYMEVTQQRTMSMFIKWNEMMRTMNFFNENDMGMMNVCSLDQNQVTPADMLEAVKPYANQREQELIDLMSKFLAGKKGRGGKSPLSFDQLVSILPPEQQSRFETIQLMMQTLGQM